ncbi:MAG: CmcI family methyltransferase [Verrucomicrobiota bacterium]
MQLLIDTTARTLTRSEGGTESSVDLYSKEAFEALSLQWVRVGWSLQYYQTFTWFGLPVLQLPEDVLRLQEVIYAVRPLVIVETGVFQGGSLLFHASLLKAMGLDDARVIGIDIQLAASTRENLRQYPLSHFITTIEGDSASAEVIAQVTKAIRGCGPVLIILDSNHTRDHVARELEAYAPLVTPGSYIIATDGIMKDLTDVPAGQLGWKTDNPYTAAMEFAARHPEFVHEQPAWLSHDSPLVENVTYWLGAWFRRLGAGSNE